MSDKENRLYELLSTKKFSELNHEEQILVLEEVGSEEAYEEMRMAVQEEEKAPHDLKASVMEAYDEKHGRSKKALWWKYAAAIAVIAVGTWVFWPAGNPENPQIAEKRQEEPNAEPEVFKEEEESIETEEAISTETRDEASEEAELDEMAEADEPNGNIEENFVEPPQDAEEKSPVQEKFEELSDSPEMESIASLQDDVAEEEIAEESADVNPAKSKSSGDMLQEALRQQDEANQPAAARSTQVNSFNAAASGVNLREIGGPYPNAYVAY